MRCHYHGCHFRAVASYVTTVRGARMVVAACSLHRETLATLIRDVAESKALRREQAAERRRWGDPARVVL